jgi:hypothetical protein
MLKSLIVAAGLILTASPVLAQTPQNATPNPAPKGQDPNRIICEVEETTGTRLGATKVCKTALEWQQLRSEHRESLEQFQRQGTSTGIPSG